MRVRRFAVQSGCATMAVLALVGFGPIHVRTQVERAEVTPQDHAPASNNALVRIVRESTDRFHDVAVAEGEGFQPMFGCVSADDAGAMGLHYVNLPLVTDGQLDPTRPEIVIYEPTPSGRLQLIGADFLVFAEAWDKKGVGTPQLMGQLLHLFESPNRFGLPAFNMPDPVEGHDLVTTLVVHHPMLAETLKIAFDTMWATGRTLDEALAAR